MNVFICLQLDHRQPSIAGDAQQVEHTPIGRGKRRHLRINVGGIKMSIERLNIPPQHALEPPLRLHAVERIALVATGNATRKQPRHQLPQFACILLRQRSLIGARAKRDLLSAVEGAARIAHAHPRKLKPMQQKSHLRSAAKMLLHDLICISRDLV